VVSGQWSVVSEKPHEHLPIGAAIWRKFGLLKTQCFLATDHWPLSFAVQ
jgi:hypothetical protein